MRRILLLLLKLKQWGQSLDSPLAKALAAKSFSAMSLFFVAIFFSSTSFQAKAGIYNETSPLQCVSTGVDTLYYTFNQVPAPSSAATITFYYQGDLDGGATGNEMFTLYDETTTSVGVSNCTGGCTVASGQCLSTLDSIKFTIPLSTLQLWALDGVIEFKVHRGSGVSQTLCTNPGSCAQIKLEYTSVSGPDDAGVTSATALQGICTGSYPVTVTVQNFGTNQITSGVMVNWEVDGVVQTPVMYNSSTLDTINGAGPSSAQVNLGNFTFNTGQVYNLKAWTSDPNGVADTVNNNDTLNTTLSLIQQPSNLSVTNVSTTTADVNWTADPSTNYRIIIVPRGTPASSGTPSGIQTSSPYAATGLNPNTAYDAYIYVDCGGGVFSDTAGPVTFWTLCTALNPVNFPYFEGFEAAVTDTFVGDAIGAHCTPEGIYDFETNDQTRGRLRFNAFAFNGSQSATLDVSTTGLTANNLILTVNMSAVDTSDSEFYLFSFYHLDHGDEQHPNDNVWIRGSTSDSWLLAYDLEANSISGTWVFSGDIDLKTILKSGGQNFSSSFQVRFGQEDETASATTPTGTDGRSFDDISIESVTCLDPFNLSLVGVTDSSATISFDGAANVYNINWGPVGFAQGSPTSSFGSGTSPYLIDSISDNTTYDVYVQSDCTDSANGLSGWVGPLTFTTLCSPFIATYTQDFDGTTAPVIDNCWSTIAPGTTTIQTVTSTDHSVPIPSFPNAIEMNSVSASNIGMLISPEFTDLPSGLNWVRVKIAYEGGGQGVNDTLFFGTMASRTDTFSFVPYDTVLMGNTNGSFIEYVFILDNTTLIGTNTHLAFSYRTGGGNDAFYFDDFIYEPTPACIPPFQATLGAVNITATTADVFWGSGSQGQKTYVEIGLPGFIPGTGNGVILDSVPGSQDTFMASGLTPQTAYEFYVQDSCLTGGLSPWAGPFTFVTKCLLSPVTLPFTEDFESYSGPISTDTTFFCGVSFSWDFERPSPASGDLFFNYVAAEGPTPPFAGVQSAGIQTTTGNPAYLVLTINMSNYSSMAQGVDLSFNFADHGDEADPEDRVWARGNINDPWVEIYDWSALNSANWELVDIPLSAALSAANQTFSSTTQIRWGQQDDSFLDPAFFEGDGLGLDDISIIEVSCPKPVNLTAKEISDSSAILSWTGNSASTDYEVWFGPLGFFQGTLTTGGVRVFTGGPDSLLVDTLSSSTCYEYLVRSVCMPGDTSDWVGPVVFCTECQPLTPVILPVFEDFENHVGPVSEDRTYFCTSNYRWSVERPGNTGDILFTYNATSGPSAPYNGLQSAGFQSLSSADPIYLILSVDMSNYVVPSTDILLSFYFADHADETSAGDKVWVRGSNTDPWVEILDWNTANATASWAFFEIKLDSVLAANSQSFSGTTQVRWGQQDNAALNGNDGFSIDDVFITEPILNDAEITDIFLDPSGCGDSNTTVNVVFANNGANAITSLPVDATVTGGVTVNLNSTYTGNLANGQSDTLSLGTINTYAGAVSVSVSATLNLMADQITLNDTMSIGPLDFIPVEPQFYTPDTVCAGSVDSAIFAAVNYPGVGYEWYAGINDTASVATGDTFKFPVSGQITWYLGYAQGASGTLTTSFADNNGCGGGNMFDVTALNAVSINGFDINMGAAAGSAEDVIVYYIANGTYAGNETTPTAWVNHETVNVTSNGGGVATFVPLSNPINISAGQTYAIYVEFDARYFDGNGTNQNYSNADIALAAGVGLCSSFGGTNNPRVFSGSVHYGTTSCSDIKKAVTLNLGTDTAIADIAVSGFNPFNFDGSGSVNADSLYWDFGDGNNASGSMVTHTYSTPGTYTITLTVFDTTSCPSTAIADTTITTTIGLEENALSRSLEVYPIPADDELMVTFDRQSPSEISIRLMDMSGRLIMELSEASLERVSSNILDVSRLAPGMYALEIESGELKALRKVTIK